jgi:hypothetical protein
VMLGVGVTVGVPVDVAVSVGVLLGCGVDVCVGLAVSVCVGDEVAVAVEVAVSVAVEVAVAVLVCVGVFVADGSGTPTGVDVGVRVAVPVCVGVAVGAVTLSKVLALPPNEFVANALTVFVNVVTASEFAVALTVIVAEAPMARLAMSTSKLEAVKVAVPAVVVTLLITSQDGKSLSVTTTPRARYVPLLVTVIV